MKNCSICGAPMHKILYYGLPHRLCLECDPPTLAGFWSNLTVFLPFNGYFMRYKGPYWKALWVWTMGTNEK